MRPNMAHHLVSFRTTVRAEDSFLLFVLKGKKNRLPVFELSAPRSGPGRDYRLGPSRHCGASL